MAEKNEPEETFKVFDRRKFTLTGEERTDIPPEEAAPTEKPPRHEPAKAAPPGKDASRQPSREPAGRSQAKSAPSAAESEEFAAFLMSLANSALVYLEAKDPVAGRSQQNMAAAKQMIDWIALVQRKTEGNRTPEESHLLENLLYELRMQFLAKNKPPKL
ncbi:MAG: DUF1844 domain-containing protein [Acidobacteria bacterium]|nr:DUF1844 domain-containing protein [Acidobacteriota bacterium]